jgi:hypothetical protein
MNAKITNPNYQPLWKQDEVAKYHEKFQKMMQERKLKKMGAKK